MEINNKKEFKLDNIPDLSSSIKSVINDTINNVVDEIFYNYKIIAKDSKSIIEKSIETRISKPLIMYNLLFMTEIYLKFFLLNFKNIREIEQFRHNIYNLIESAKNIGTMHDFDELIDLLKRIKNKRNQNLDYNNYYHFKYNHQLAQNDLIFNYECTEREILRIKDVIEWLDSNFPIV